MIENERYGVLLAQNNFFILRKDRFTLLRCYDKIRAMEFLIRFTDTLFNLIKIAIVVRILMSWFRPNPSNPIYQLTVGITEPILRPLRKIMPRTGMLDFSPIIALIGLDIINALVLQIIYRLPPF